MLFKEPSLKANVAGRIVIEDLSDPDNPVTVLDTPNAIHKGNFAKHLAFAMGGKENHNIHFMVFGTGGGSAPKTSNTPSPETTNIHAPKFGKVVNTIDDVDNSITGVSHFGSYADLVVVCTIGMSDIASFNELGLLSINPDNETTLTETINEGQSNEATYPTGILLTHATFPLITTAATTRISYTIRIEL